jgi:hypothetical protein
MKKQLHNAGSNDISVKELRHLVKAMLILEGLLEKQNYQKTGLTTPVNYAFGPSGNLYTYIRKG